MKLSYSLVKLVSSCLLQHGAWTCCKQSICIQNIGHLWDIAWPYMDLDKGFYTRIYIYAFRVHWVLVIYGHSLTLNAKASYKTHTEYWSCMDIDFQCPSKFQRLPSELQSASKIFRFHRKVQQGMGYFIMSPSNWVSCSKNASLKLNGAYNWLWAQGTLHFIVLKFYKMWGHTLQFFFWYDNDKDLKRHIFVAHNSNLVRIRRQ